MSEVKVDGNKKMLYQHLMGASGKMTEDEQYVIKMDALKEIKDSGIDYCSCPSACPHHGKCWECVLIHRGHRDHLPYCLWDMVNEKIDNMQKLTEGSFKNYDPKNSPCMDFNFEEEDK